MSQLVYQTVAIYILLNISTSKQNQAVKFGQLVGYNMRHTFVERPYTKSTKSDEKAITRLLSILSISLDQQS